MKYFVEYLIPGCNKVWKHYYDDVEILRRVIASLEREGLRIVTYGQER